MPKDNLRYELKMRCSPHLLAQARTWIRLHPARLRETYPLRQVNNLYFDTPHLSSFNANQVGISKRQKLRLRWYGENINTLLSSPTLELKLKDNLLGDKKQSPLACVIDWQQPYDHILQILHSTVSKKWQQLINIASQPTLINWYQREYYATFDDKLRVTLDYAQTAYDQRMSSYPNFDRPSPLTDSVVIEMKASPNDNMRLQEAMAYFPLPRSRNSKYVNGMNVAWR